jgi:hypothetical protein
VRRADTATGRSNSRTSWNDCMIITRKRMTHDVKRTHERGKTSQRDGTDNEGFVLLSFIMTMH